MSTTGRRYVNGGFAGKKFTNAFAIVAAVALALVVTCYTFWLEKQLQSANKLVRGLQHELAFRDKAIAHLGEPLPGELLRKLRATVSGQQGAPLVFYCVSLESCNPCVEQNIRFFRSLALAARGSFTFCIVSKTMDWKEASTLRQRYRIDWDAIFLEFDPSHLGVTELPTVLLASLEGRELFRFSPSSNRPETNRFGERIVSQVVSAGMEPARR